MRGQGRGQRFRRRPQLRQALRQRSPGLAGDADHQQQMQAEVIATLITDTQVSVASAAPITIPMAASSARIGPAA